MLATIQAMTVARNGAYSVPMQEPARSESERGQRDHQADGLRSKSGITAHVAELLARRRVDRTAPSPEDSRHQRYALR